MSGTATEEKKLSAEDREKLARNIAYVDSLVARAKGGDESVIPALRKVMKQVPSLYESLNHIADCAIFAWAKAIAGSDLLHRECVISEFWEYADSIIGPKPTALEKSLAQRVSLCRMQTLHAEAALGQLGNDAFTKRGEMLEKRVASCQKRHSQAHKDLTMLQKQMGNLPTPMAVDKDGLDPVQRYAQQLKKEQEAAAKNTQHGAVHGTTHPDPETHNTKLPDSVTTSGRADKPTDVPLRPPVKGTKRVVTSESMLTGDDVRLHSIFSAMNERTEADEQRQHQDAKRKSAERIRAREESAV